MRNFALIATIGQDGAIGQDGGLPWGTLLQNIAFFRAVTSAADPPRMARTLIADPRCLRSHSVQRRLDTYETTGNVLVMGRKTPRTLSHSLQERHIIVLSRAPLRSEWHGARVDTPAHPLWGCVTSLDDALWEGHLLQAPNVFVCGGYEPFARALMHPGLTTMYLTEVQGTYPASDRWFPHWGPWLDTGLWHLKPYGPWIREAVSEWIQEPERPRYRFGLWVRASVPEGHT